MIPYVDHDSVGVSISENDDGVGVVTIQTVDDAIEYKIREEDEFDVKIRAGIRSTERNDTAEPEISEVRVNRFFSDET